MNNFRNLTQEQQIAVIEQLYASGRQRVAKNFEKKM